MSENENMSSLSVADVIGFISRWAPLDTALPDDNPGLQVGRRDAPVTNILVTLEVTDRIIEEAVENQVSLILTHHPLIFQPLKRLDVDTWLGRKLEALIKNDIAVYAAHTNLDGARDGVSFALIKRLGVPDPQFLKPSKERWLKKIAVFVPAPDVDNVRRAMAEAGAGIIGDYTFCSYNIEGKGTFWGGKGTHPALGSKGRLETVDEVRLEMILPSRRQHDVIQAMRGAHPYEEPAYDLYPLDNVDVSTGFGAIGDLPEPVLLTDLFDTIKNQLGVKALAVMEGPAHTVSRLAVCGGSGEALVEDACRQGAQAFVTGEMKYHTFLEYEGKTTVIVAGHYATEQVIVPVWSARLREWLGDRPVSVIETKILTNPIKHII